jgi:LysR family glycine cleavage system transcriptional activator
MSLKQDLPFLNALAVFEAAARTSRFTAAAEELHIAQSAVSRHVSNLESYFQLQLFERQGKRVQLTPHGRRLADSVSVGFGHIRAVLNELRRETQSKAVTIACSYDFAYLWLMPRFALLRDQVGERELRLFASHNYADFDADNVDLSIRYGQRTDWPDATCVKLFGEEAFPICSPKFLEANPQVQGGDPARLREVPLLRADQRGLTWRDWFKRLGHTPPTLKGAVFSNYMGVLYEVLAGQGVALGYTHMLGDLIEQGQLIRISEVSVESDSAYFAVHRAGSGSLADALAARFVSLVAGPDGPAIIIRPIVAAAVRGCEGASSSKDGPQTT